MVQFKTVSGQSFKLDLPENSKIADVKAEVAKSQGMDAEKMVLIYQGKVLKNDTTLADNKVSETGFMVCMVPKVKAAPAAVPAAAAVAVAPPPTDAAAPVAVPAAAAPEAAAAVPEAAPAAGNGDAYSAAASELATGAQLESKVAQICEMGFDRESVMKAMRAAFNNPERAVDYLMNGIPASAQPQPPPSQPPTAQAPAAAATAGAAGGAPLPTSQAAAVEAAAGGPNAQPLDMFPQGMPASLGGGGAPARAGALSFLRENAQFQSLRVLVQANPQILEPMLHELGKQNPRLLEQINANQAEFLEMVNEPVEAGASAEMLAQLGYDEDMGEGELEENTIALTQEEVDSVGRLVGLGFTRNQCIEAYLACDKNEEMAANYLLENVMDD